MVPAQIHVEPADDDGHGRVRTHGHEEEPRVLNAPVVVHRDQDAETGDGYGDGDQREDEAVPCVVGAETDDHGEGEGARPRRYAVELRLDGRPLVR